MRSETKKEMNDLSDYLLCTRGLTKKFGHHHAVDHVDLHIPKGAIYGFIGRNGAGKTTCLKMISGLSKPTEGENESPLLNMELSKAGLPVRGITITSEELETYFLNLTGGASNA